MDYLTITIIVFQLIVCILIAVLMAGFRVETAVGGVKGYYARKKEENYEKTWTSLEKKRAYDDIDEWLLSRGVKWRMGARFTPFDYMAFRFLGSLAIGLFFMLIHPMGIIPGVLIGYVFIEWYFNHKDAYDNSEMINDISQMYGIVALQLRNKVFLSEVVYECYLCVGHPRLKVALLELSSEIGRLSTIKEASVRFRKKFNNEHIDMFAKTLEQYDNAGEGLDMFKDLESQIESINEALAIREEKRIDDVCGIFQILIFLGAILFVGYIMFQMLTGSEFF